MFGTKCASAPFPWSPPTLGKIYNDVVGKHGSHALHKPVPGHKYRKMFKPLTDIDRPYFRLLPSDITILSPSRLYRSTGWKYNGRVYLDCECAWEFEYSYPWDKGTRTDWMAVGLLSYCYIPEIMTTTPLAGFAFYNRNRPDKLTPVQLNLFA